jgi:hypothetical protein
MFNPPTKILPPDEFLLWMSFINPGMMHSGNLYLTDYSIRHMPFGGAVVEIGSFAGFSTNLIIYLMRKHARKNHFYSVDAWNFGGVRMSFERQGFIPGSTVSFADYRAHVIQTFRRNVLLFSKGDLPHHLQLDSDPFFEMWRTNQTVTDFFGQSTTLGGDISMAYIDGDHTYKQSLKDFENVDRHLLSGGFIILDDSADSNFGSARAAQEMATRSDYRVVEKNPNYCFQKR